MNHKYFSIVSILLLGSIAWSPAQDEPTDDSEVEETTGGDALRGDDEFQARIERGLAVPLPRTLRKGSLTYVIEHRTRTPIDDDPFHNFLGFDTGEVKIGFGLRYGIADELDVGLYRVNGTVERFDTYQFDARHQLLNEQDHGLDLALIGGASWFTIQSEDDVWAGFGALMLGRSFWDRLYLHTGVLYHDNSTARDKTAEDEKDSTSILGSVTLQLKESLYWTTDYSVPVAGYDALSPGWASGLKVVTHGHTFSLVGGNMQYISLDGMAAGTSFEKDDVVLGFSISREFQK